MLFIIQIIRVFKWFHTQFQATKKIEVNLNSLAFPWSKGHFLWMLILIGETPISHGLAQP
jgi:hypothetical protein